jgi:hypothetical protein
VVPDLIGGHLLMAGDNVSQNYPLHVLVGSMLRRGQLPFWDQYIFSGSPLLAGFNAGAFYPLMAFFVVLPDRAAWIATEAVLFSAIGVGMYVYLRALALSTWSCFLGALTFTFGGAVFGQINHLDMTEGFAALPFMLLAVHHIVREGRWRWAVVLGLAYATVILGGAPEAMLDEAILLVVYAVVSAGADRARWWRVLTRGGAGAALGLSVAAIQWLPGLNDIAQSQRAAFGSGFASTGSYPPPFGVMSLVPYLFGGFHHLGEAGYFSHYGLAEVSIYVGILPLIALVTMWHPRWPSRLAHAERVRWYLVGGVGLLLAFGANTPLEHLFNVLPLYGHQRLQSRNMIDVTTAVCVLFAGWVDRSARTDELSSFAAFDRVVGALPSALVAGLVVWAFGAPASLLRILGDVSRATNGDVTTVRRATLIALAFCVAATAVAWVRPRVRPRSWVLLASALMVVDLGFTGMFGQLSVLPSNTVLSGHTPIENFVAAHLAPDGRFDVYDPQDYGGATHSATGLPDLNILAGLPSVAGYASIVNGDYSIVTNTHTLGELNIHQLAVGSLNGLDLQEVVTVPEYFLVPVIGQPTSIAAVRQEPQSSHVDPVLPLGNGANFDDKAYPFYPEARVPLGAGQSSSWFFGEVLHPSSASLLFSSPATTAVVRFGTVTDGGITTWDRPVLVGAGSNHVSDALPDQSAAGLAVQVLFGRLPLYQGLVSVDGRAFELDGSLSSALRPGVWRQQGTVEGYTLFVRDKAPVPMYALTPAGTSGPPVVVQQSLTKLEVVRVDATTPVRVVRNVAWDTGWQGFVSVNGGPARPVRVAHADLVQQIAAPAGHDVVTFRYEPPHLLVASTLSAGGVLAPVVAGCVVLWRRRRRRGGVRAAGAGAAQ